MITCDRCDRKGPTTTRGGPKIESRAIHITPIPAEVMDNLWKPDLCDVCVKALAKNLDEFLQPLPLL